VKIRDGEYIPATPIPGTIVVNIGDLMQRWTADRLIATFFLFLARAYPHQSDFVVVSVML
jgi:hypothetical protein